MSRRDTKTINLPREMVEWVDALTRWPESPRPLGIASRDEFVRTAVAVLGAALMPQKDGAMPLDVVTAIVRDLERIRDR